MFKIEVYFTEHSEVLKFGQVSYIEFQDNVVILTFEFDNEIDAQIASENFRLDGKYVEGPSRYDKGRS